MGEGRGLKHSETTGYITMQFLPDVKLYIPSVPDPRSCIGSLSALGPVHDLIDSKQSIIGSATEGMASLTP